MADPTVTGSMRNGTTRRIISLLPGATEMLAAIGADAQLVGISHECDWPAGVTHLPRVTATPIDPSLPSAAIDRAVREHVAAGTPVIGIDAAVLRALRPDLLVTQMLCDVCAVADGEAVRLTRAMERPPEVLALHGRTLDGVWQDLRTLGGAVGRDEAADRVADVLAGEVATLRRRHATAAPPRVIAIEWLAPLYLAGHWVPEMIAAAGGVDVGAEPGSHSVVRGWDEVMALDLDLICIILCGFDVPRARHELALIAETPQGRWLATRRLAFIDGNAYTSRPGPRLVEGVRRMAEAIGPLLR